MRLRYGGSAHRWGTAIYVASKDSYEDQIWFSGSTEEIFDLVCDLHVTNAATDHQPHTSQPSTPEGLTARTTKPDSRSLRRYGTDNTLTLAEQLRLIDAERCAPCLSIHAFDGRVSAHELYEKCRNNRRGHLLGHAVSH